MEPTEITEAEGGEAEGGQPDPYVNFQARKAAHEGVDLYHLKAREERLATASALLGQLMPALAAIARRGDLDAVGARASRGTRGAPGVTLTDLLALRVHVEAMAGPISALARAVDEEVDAHLSELVQVFMGQREPAASPFPPAASPV